MDNFAREKIMERLEIIRVTVDYIMQLLEDVEDGDTFLETRVRADRLISEVMDIDNIIMVEERRLKNDKEI